jgi:hypothetical protein
MSSHRDARDRLRAANPLPPEDAPSADSPQATALFERIVRTSPEAEPRRTWVSKRRAWFLLPAVLLAAAAGYGIFHKVSEPGVIACYPQPSLSVPPAVVSGAGQDPIAACSDLWQAGEEFNPEGVAAAPPLAACVLRTGAIGVFPDTLGADACAILGLTPISQEPGEDDENSAVLRVQEALANEFLGRCVGQQEAVTIVERELSNQGLSDWRVEAATPFTEPEPCASAAFDVPGRVISLIPVSDST